MLLYRRDAASARRVSINAYDRPFPNRNLRQNRLDPRVRHRRPRPSLASRLQADADYEAFFEARYACAGERSSEEVKW
jgi:hypothetical protein